MTARTDSSRHVQAIVPAEVHRRLRDLSYDTQRPVADLVFDGILLVLRYHDRGGGLQEPVAPSSSSATTGGAR